jgi:hypothetical protein
VNFSAVPDFSIKFPDRPGRQKIFGPKRSGFFLFVTEKYADKTRETIPLYIIPVLKVAVQEKGTVLKERILPGRI